MGCAIAKFSLHIREGQTPAVHFPILELGILRKERGDLCLKIGLAQADGIDLHLVEVQKPRKLVLADEIDLILALPVPPAANAGIAMLFQELRLEISLQRDSREHIKVSFDDSDQLVEHLLLDQVLVFVDEPEPKPKEAIVDPIKAVLGRRKREFSNEISRIFFNVESSLSRQKNFISYI